VIRFYNGMTAEVKNTDAEGRLVLADALSYAVKNYKIDGIISLATLTGSCAYALGPFFCGLMSQNDALAAQVFTAASRSGDRAWPLPFHDDYKVAIKSDIADLCNIGQDKYRAGAITAGFFLKAFVGDCPFVHLDIAGTSFNVPDISYYRPGGTGFGVRLLLELFLTGTLSLDPKQKTDW
jgi:leucyl aminopeptidase